MYAHDDAGVEEHFGAEEGEFGAGGWGDGVSRGEGVEFCFDDLDEWEERGLGRGGQYGGEEAG